MSAPLFHGRKRALSALCAAQLALAWTAAAVVTLPLLAPLRRHPDGLFALYADGGRVLMELADASRPTLTLALATLGLLAALYAALWMALGALLYPTYRYHVRALFLDQHHPMVSNLFDVKENLATIALPLAFALGVLGGRLSEPEEKPYRKVYAAMSLFVTAVVWFNVVSGVLIVSYRAV